MKNQGLDRFAPKSALVRKGDPWKGSYKFLINLCYTWLEAAWHGLSEYVISLNIPSQDQEVERISWQMLTSRTLGSRSVFQGFLHEEVIKLNFKGDIRDQLDKLYRMVYNSFKSIFHCNFELPAPYKELKPLN